MTIHNGKMNENYRFAIDISLQSGPPGSGKTYDLLHIVWKKFKGRCLYFTHSHEACMEKYLELIKSGVKKEQIRLIYGLARICPCVQKDLDSCSPREKFISSLIYHNFSNKIVCFTCKDIKAFPQKDCPYKKQFDNIKKCHIVITVIQCAYGPTIFKKFKPEYIAMDDCFYYKNPQTKISDLTEQLMYLSGIARLDFYSKNPLKELSDTKNFKKTIEKLSKAYRKDITGLVKKIEKKDEFNKDLKFNKMRLIHPKNFEEYIEKARKYGFRNRFADPAFFYIIDYISKQKTKGKKVPFKIIDAIFQKDFLELMKKRYSSERKVGIVWKKDKFEPRTFPNNSVIYRMGQKNAWYSEDSIDRPETQKNISEEIRWILKYYFNNKPDLKIGVITRKPKSQWIKHFGNEEKAMKYKMSLFFPKEFVENITVETYGNLRGKNSLQNCDVLFIIGSYVTNKTERIKQFPQDIESMIQEVGDWFCLDPEKENTFFDKEKKC